MAKFLVIYTSPISAEQQMANANPAEAEAGMKMWMDWMGRVGSALVDPGSPLGNGTTISNDGGKPSSLQVAGYSMLEASDIAAAKELVTGHPHLMIPGATVELHEVLPMPGM